MYVKKTWITYFNTLIYCDRYPTLAKSKAMAVFGYGRVSTAKKTAGNQRLKAERAGYALRYWFADTVSGKRTLRSESISRRCWTNSGRGDTVTQNRGSVPTTGHKLSIRRKRTLRSHFYGVAAEYYRNLLGAGAIGRQLRRGCEVRSHQRRGTAPANRIKKHEEAPS